MADPSKVIAFGPPPPTLNKARQLAQQADLHAQAVARLLVELRELLTFGDPAKPSGQG